MKEDSSAFSSVSLWHAGLADGRLRVMNDSNEETDSCMDSLKDLRASAHAIGGALVIENAPQEIKGAIDAWGDVGTKASLMRRVKQELDPDGLLSPGRF